MYLHLTLYQLGYVMRLLSPIFEGSASSFEATAEASHAFNEKLQVRLQSGIWAQCNSYYRIRSTGKVFGVFPGRLSQWWWLMRRPVRWSDYKLVGAPAKKHV